MSNFKAMIIHSWNVLFPHFLDKIGAKFKAIKTHNWSVTFPYFLNQERGLTPSEASRPASEAKNLHLLFLMRLLSFVVLLAGREASDGVRLLS